MYPSKLRCVWANNQNTQLVQILSKTKNYQKLKYPRPSGLVWVRKAHKYPKS